MHSPAAQDLAASLEPARLFRLFVERDAGDGGGVEVIDVPRRLTLAIVDHLVSVAPGRRDGTLVLEPVFDASPPVLVASVVHPTERVFVNGAEIGPTHVLEIKDVVTCDGGDVRLHVSMRYRPYLGPPRPEHVGQSCPVCLTAITAADAPASTVLVCVGCGAVMHEEIRLGDGVGEKLQCSRAVSSCPVCRTPLIREETTVYVPELE
jgi:hypothetical protein